MKTLLALSTGLLLALPSVANAQERPDTAPLIDGLKDLRALNKQLVSIAEPCSKATVALMSRGGAGSGSGVIVSKEGLVLTAAHVVDSLSEEVIVVFPDGKRFEAKKLGGDFDRDAALVQITEEGSFPYVKIGKSGDLLRDQWCIAMGHPGGFDPARTPPLRLGRVLRNANFVTTDCAVVGGDSGGPLFNVKGEVVGIHSNIGATLLENRHVPVDVFHDQWDKFKEGRRTGRRFAARPQVDLNRPVLGVEIRPTEGNTGTLLGTIRENSPAQKVGLKQGDIVTKINDKKVSGPEEMIEVVSEFKVGDEVSVTYLREEKEQVVKLKLARLGDLIEEEQPPRERRRRGRRPQEPAPEEEPKEKEPEEEEPAEEEESEPECGDDEEEEDKEAEDKEKKEEEGDDEKEGEGEVDQEKMLREMLERAMKDRRFQLDPEELEKLGGAEGLQKMAEELLKNMDPELLNRLRQARPPQPTGPDQFFESAMKALRPVTTKVGKSVVVVLADDKMASLGTVVTKAGHIVAKHTETAKGTITAKVGDKTIPLTLVKRFPKRDLALFSVESAEGLQPVRWAKGKKNLPLGTILTAAAPGGEPLGIGLVSVKTRPLGGVGFLGVQAGEVEGGEGVRIVQALRGGPAREAGLRANDVITGINGKAFTTPQEFGSIIREYRAGQEVEFAYRRGEEEKSVKVKLAEREGNQATNRLRRMNEMSGPMSAIVSGFPLALQHDIPLSPNECGGPLLDLDGRCVGINVSRAGRVKTLAIPTRDLQELLKEAKSEKSKPSGKELALEEERKKLMEELKRVEKHLNEVEEKLKSLRKE